MYNGFLSFLNYVLTLDFSSLQGLKYPNYPSYLYCHYRSSTQCNQIIPFESFVITFSVTTFYFITQSSPLVSFSQFFKFLQTAAFSLLAFLKCLLFEETNALLKLKKQQVLPHFTISSGNSQYIRLQWVYPTKGFSVQCVQIIQQAPSQLLLCVTVLSPWICINRHHHCCRGANNEFGRQT